MVSYVVLMNFMDNINSLLIAYIISLLYGIVKNFHLMENFKAFIGEKKSLRNNSLEKQIEDERK